MIPKRRDSKGRILRNGEVQRQDGRYMYRYADAAGNRQTVYSWKLVETDVVPGGKRCKEALRDMEKRIQRDLEDQIRTVDASTTTVNELFSSFMRLRTDLKETTRCNYIQLYDIHIRPNLGSKKLKSVKFSDIQQLYITMMQERRLKASTVQSVHSILYQMFDTAVMDNVIRTNPCANVLKNLRRMFNMKQEKRHALTIEEQIELIRYVESSTRYQRLGPLFTVLLGTGLRIGEALGLRWADCDFDNDIIHVTHTLLYKEQENSGYGYRISEPKTKAGIRDIPMLSAVKESLLQERDKRQPDTKEPFTVDGYTGFIFLNSSGKVFTPAFVFDSIRSITYDHNKEEWLLAQQENRDPIYLPKFSAHILRHTFCTRLCENETNIKIIQDIMGHKNIRTTMDVYNEATATQKKLSFQALEGKMGLS